MTKQCPTSDPQGRSCLHGDTIEAHRHTRLGVDLGVHHCGWNPDAGVWPVTDEDRRRWDLPGDLDALGLDPEKLRAEIRECARRIAREDAQEFLGWPRPSEQMIRDAHDLGPIVWPPLGHPGWDRLAEALDHANDWPPGEERTSPRIAGHRKFWRGRRG